LSNAPISSSRNDDQGLLLIISTFNNRTTSGFVEGFNYKIKVVNRQCYGIFNIQHLGQRILLDTLGADLIITN